MTLRIKKGRLRFCLYIPGFLTGVAVKKIARNAAKRSEEQNEKFVVTIPNKQTVKEITQAIRKAKKFHGKLVLVSVAAADGTKVKITL